MDKTDAQVIQFSWVKKNWEWDVLIETSVFQLRDVCCFFIKYSCQLDSGH